MILALLAALAFSAPAPAPGRADAVAVETALNDWHDAAAKADEERYFAHFAENGVFLGTDASERWDVPAFRKYAHPHFAMGKAWTLVPRDRHVIVSGTTAWFDERVDSPKYGEGRGTGVLVFANGVWKIAQYNYTVPIPNEKFLEVLRLIQPKRRNDSAPSSAPAPNR
ncbi:MAG: nuclear transport factor 2 family protein [Elusimicrobia bacterium]|nr:nuclear transport factor 2 family protein [Elusimicrobiota bacterium]